MRSHKLITGLALAAGLTAPVALTAAPAGAQALASMCRVELYDIDAFDIAERDGEDELRFSVGGNLFPRFNANFFDMRNGDDGDPADFENPATTVSSTGSAGFSLREVDPPIVGSGDDLGTVTASGPTHCAPLAVGGVAYVEDYLEGAAPTWYSYRVKLKVTGL
ncbi:hypothetical protein [Bailinhaonella thermotolerans]|uniref:Allene oxide cyclase barrel-like domain-containing protein n=1 Tax=Bailinhaonella thermotolerans TaxID=1070861 RepID=A0A3A4B4B5_9ACTN|nr:hypothetical protein [Bailinhaonella thermotolerans]RJL32799.1 hypothetical protein D5H75_15180 [Bailinhaonella thermotolerans]